jgi:hypothetical protein
MGGRRVSTNGAETTGNPQAKQFGPLTSHAKLTQSG